MEARPMEETDEDEGLRYNEGGGKQQTFFKQQCYTNSSPRMLVPKMLANRPEFSQKHFGDSTLCCTITRLRYVF